MLPVEEVDDEGSVVDSGIPKNSERVYKHRCMTKGFQHIMLSINSIYSHCHSRSLPSWQIGLKIVIGLSEYW